jgi:hypothetical protein
MFLPFLLIIFGIAGLAKGGFKLTRNRRVSGSTGRTLGGILLAGGILSFIDGLFGLLALGIVIAIGLVKAEKIGSEQEKLSSRQTAYRIGIGIAIAIVVVLGPTILLTLLGPTIGRIYGSLQGTTVTPKILISVPANEINLRSSELGGSFVLDTEVTKDKFVDDIVKDGNQRLFVSPDLILDSKVIVFDFYPEDTIESIRESAKQEITQGFKGEAIEFDSAKDVQIADRGSLQGFSNKDTGEKGYVLTLLKKNIFIRLVLFGNPDKINADDLQTYAQIILGRIK